MTRRGCTPAAAAAATAPLQQTQQLQLLLLLLLPCDCCSVVVTAAALRSTLAAAGAVPAGEHAPLLAALPARALLQAEDKGKQHTCYKSVIEAFYNKDTQALALVKR
jgi:hypothetical protein